MSCRSWFVVAVLFLTASVVSAQKTTNIGLNLNLTSSATPNVTTRFSAIANGSLTSLGPVTVQVDATAPADKDGNPLSNLKGVISFVFNRLDSFDVTVDAPPLTVPPPVTGNIANGNGAYAGATGSVTFTFSGADGNTISAAGSVTVSGKTTAFTMPNVTVAPFGSGEIFRDSITGTGIVTPFGNVTVTGGGGGGDNNTRQSGFVKLAFNANDSFSIWFSFIGLNPPASIPGVIFGGTGVYAGAAGSVPFSIGAGTGPTGLTVTGSGTITQSTTAVPTITSVRAAFGTGSSLSGNTWLEIKGTNLVPPTTPAAGVIWSNAPEFATGKMPTLLQGISVTVNGAPAFVYFFCSAATNPACLSDQINVLTPLGVVGGSDAPSLVIVTSGSVASAPFLVPVSGKVAPSFLLFSTKGHVVATHTDFSLLGPTSLYPGASTPAKVGETVIVYAIGFGGVTTPLTNGSSTQSGTLPQKPTCRIGASVANVVAANLVSPGLYAFGITIPVGTPSGDNLIWCGYQVADGSTDKTPAGNLITVQ